VTAADLDRITAILDDAIGAIEKKFACSLAGDDPSPSPCPETGFLRVLALGVRHEWWSIEALIPISV